jgi:hypothetical protein
VGFLIGFANLDGHMDRCLETVREIAREAQKVMAGKKWQVLGYAISVLGDVYAARGEKLVAEELYTLSSLGRPDEMDVGSDRYIPGISIA